MTKFYLTYDVIAWSWKKPRAIKVTNNYLIRFVSSDIMFNAYRFLNRFEWYIYDDRLKMERILCVIDDDVYLLENKYKQK